MRQDDFSPSVVRRLRERAAHICSNPDCRRLTVEPHSDPAKAIIKGKACHIHGAAPLGPRYNSEQTPEERSGIENGIWLCSVCSDLIDKDPNRYSADFLRQWKSEHEKWISEEGMVPKLPAIVIKDSPGIPLPPSGPATVTSDDCDKFRYRELLLENPNRIAVFGLTLQIQLPEPIFSLVNADIPPGLAVRFQPEHLQWVASAQGEGASVVRRGPQGPTTNWKLDARELPARSSIRFGFLTIVDWLDAAVEAPLAWDEHVLQFYIKGQFLFEYRGEMVPRDVIVPLQFAPSSRAIESFPSQSDISPYTSICQTFR